MVLTVVIAKGGGIQGSSRNGGQGKFDRLRGEFGIGHKTGNGPRAFLVSQYG